MAGFDVESAVHLGRGFLFFASSCLVALLAAGGLAACSAGEGGTGDALGAIGEGGAGHFRDAQVTSLDASLVLGDGSPDDDATTAQDATTGDDAAPPADAGTDAPIDAPVDAPVDAPPADTGSGTCTKTLTIATVTITPSGCPLNEDVTAAPATLTYPCAGGTGTVTLGTQTFSGSVANGQVGLENLDTFLVSAGCTWQSTQRLEGALGGPLAYSYSEKVITSGCSGAGACKGSGSCSVK